MHGVGQHARIVSNHRLKLRVDYSKLEACVAQPAFVYPPPWIGGWISPISMTAKICGSYNISTLPRSTQRDQRNLQERKRKHALQNKLGPTVVRITSPSAVATCAAPQATTTVPSLHSSFNPPSSSYYPFSLLHSARRILTVVLPEKWER